MNPIALPSILIFTLSCLAPVALKAAARATLVCSPITIPTQADKRQRQLVLAIASRNLKLIKAAIAAGAQPSLPDADGISPVGMACGACIRDANDFVEDGINTQIYDLLSQYTMPPHHALPKLPTKDDYFDETIVDTPGDLVYVFRNHQLKSVSSADEESGEGSEYEDTAAEKSSEKFERTLP